MKKILSIALAVVMVLSLASVAMAFNWSAPTSSLSNFDYQIDVIKFTTTTQAYGSASFQEDNAATAVNGAPVYFAIKLTVPNLSATNEIRESAVATVKFTAIDGVKGVEDLDISNLSEGVYYYYDATQSFQKIEFFRANVRGMNYMAETPVYAMTCLDTDTAKVYAEVSSDRPLDRWFNVGNYDIGKETIANGALGTTAQPVVTVNQEGSGTDPQILYVTFDGIKGGAAADYVYSFGSTTATISMVDDKSASAGNVESAISNIIADGTVVTLGGVSYSIGYYGDTDGTLALVEVPSKVGNRPYTDAGDKIPSGINVSVVGGTGYDTITVVEFREAATPIGSGDLVAVLPLNSNDKVLGIVTSNEEAAAFDPAADDPIGANYTAKTWAGSAAVIDLYAWLDDGNANSFLNAVNAGEVYMTDSNMRTAFGFANSVSDSATWAANSTPIILDPTVSIPKTGDNASVIGFAMIMAAVVLAAVAVKKVKA